MRELEQHLLLLKEEGVQSRQEGKDDASMAALEAKNTRATTREELETIHSQMLALPVRGDFSYEEPNELEEIRALRTGGRRSWKLPDADSELLDRLEGAWLGRTVGCALGKPVEMYMEAHNGLDSWVRQKTYLTAIDPEEWPLRDYIPQSSPAIPETGVNRPGFHAAVLLAASPVDAPIF